MIDWQRDTVRMLGKQQAFERRVAMRAAVTLKLISRLT